MPGNLLPRTVLLWGIRIVLILAFVFHIHSAAGLTLINRRARPKGSQYQSKRDYVAADYASRTMRFTGIIVLLFLIFHLMDLTWGNANSQFLRGDPYNNLVYSLQRPGAAIVYAIGVHCARDPPLPRQLVALSEPGPHQPPVQLSAPTIRAGLRRRHAAGEPDLPGGGAAAPRDVAVPAHQTTHCRLPELVVVGHEELRRR